MPTAITWTDAFASIANTYSTAARPQWQELFTTNLFTPNNSIECADIWQTSTSNKTVSNLPAKH